MLYITLIIFCLVHSNMVHAWNHTGTTPGLQNIILGRCFEYQGVYPSGRKDSLIISVNCTEVWELFKKSFAYKEPCNSTVADYQPLFDKIKNNKNLTNEAMLWSGTREIVHDFTHINNNYETLEDTFPGYLANDLKWCGCVNCTGGIDHNSCNHSCSTRATHESPYWDLASKQFAEKATGRVYVMVNGTAKGRNTAYFNGTIFARKELPTLGRMDKVTKLIILVVFDVDEEPKEKCGEGSLIQLLNDAERLGIPKSKINCIDNPRMVRYVLCAKYPHAQQCHEHGKQSSNAINLKVLHSVIVVVLLTWIFYSHQY